MRTEKDSPEQLRMFILDVLRHDDIEQLSSILKLLNDWDCVGWRDHWSHDFTEEEAIPVLGDLCRCGYVTIHREHESQDELVAVDPETVDIQSDRERLWFHLTEEGRKRWDTWDVAEEASD